MIDLFNTQYTEETNYWQMDDEIQLGKANYFFITALRDGRYIFLRDENNNHWAYAKYGWTIKMPGFYCKDFPIGTYSINNNTYIRVADPEIIMNKIGSYLAPYILNHIWKTDDYSLNIN